MEKEVKFLNGVPNFENPFSKIFFLLVELFKAQEITLKEKQYLKAIMENDELLQACADFQINEIDKFRQDIGHILRFVRARNALQPFSPLSVKVPMCRQFSFYSQIPSPMSKRGSSPTNSPTKSCSPRWTSRASLEDLKPMETLRLKNLEMEGSGMS